MRAVRVIYKGEVFLTGFIKETVGGSPELRAELAALALEVWQAMNRELAYFPDLEAAVAERLAKKPGVESAVAIGKRVPPPRDWQL